MQVYKNIYPIVCMLKWACFHSFFTEKRFPSIYKGENDLKRDFIYKTFTKYLHELHTMVSCDVKSL